MKAQQQYKNTRLKWLQLWLLLLGSSFSAAAQQQNDHSNKQLFDWYKQSKTDGFSDEQRYYIVYSRDTFISKRAIRNINDELHILSIKKPQLYTAIQQKHRIAPANNYWKLSPALGQTINHKSGPERYIICVSHIDSFKSAIQLYKDQVSLLSIDPASSCFIIRCTRKWILEKILPLNEVIFADEYQRPESEASIIGYDRSRQGINATDFLLPQANGKNIVVGVKEQNMDKNDLDIQRRVLNSTLAASGIQLHATVIASIIGGAGNSFYDGRGIAHQSRFFPSSFENLFADDEAILAANKVSVQNHSYGTVIQQFYGAEAMSYDRLTASQKNYLAVFSAGNRGTSFSTEGKYANLTGFANLTGNFKMAKNIVTVAAVNSAGAIADESSSGPLYDGRVAPQLTAHGPGGTSDAAALVSGTAAVLQQVYADSNNQQLPPAALVKAILYNTAEDVYNKGIDYKTGYGLLNSYAAIRSLQKKEYEEGVLAANQTWTKTIAVPANAAQLKVTLSWTDTAAAVNNNRALINDLDLEIKSLNDNSSYLPWVLSNAANSDSLQLLPVRRRDSLNTAEQVSIDLPPAGSYQLIVASKNISNPVSFCIAYKIDTLQRFEFISPLHASDINRSENPDLAVKWRAVVANSHETANLYISFDRANSWQLLQPVQLTAQEYKWPIKDTACTVMFRMSTSFGDFFSKEVMNAPLTRPAVDFICSDSFRLSWNQHAFANNYDIFALTDQPYLEKIASTSDSFMIFRRASFPSLVYAVQPVLSNGLPAARSYAVNIEQQGVNCFYKTLYYELQDNNNLKLVFETGAPSFIDSIFFERISASGERLETYERRKAVTGVNNYIQLVNKLPAGTIYIRVKLLLKSGAMVYTDKVMVTTTGTNKILFYPNPAHSHHKISYVLQQGLPGDSRLRLYDINGRLIREYVSLPPFIEASGLPSGLIVYKLISFDGKELETGKLLLVR